jgi:transcriptional regulator with XRE-family HTH domain
LTALRQLRADTGKTRAQVAADLQISERHLLRLEKGDTPLRRRWALAFAAYYGVEVDDIDEARA